MSKEELNQALSTDELKDVAGGSAFMKLGDIKGAKMHEKKRNSFSQGQTSFLNYLILH